MERIEMTATIIGTVISAISAIICAYIAADNKKRGKIEDEKDRVREKREELRAKEGRLQLQMINANSQLTIGLAMAMKNGHCNGEVEEGLRAVKDANDAYVTFLEEVAIDNIRGK